MMMGMSPRLASINSDSKVDDQGPAQDENMNSSCKDTMKMNDRREFSFFESVNREFGNVNVGPIYQVSLGQSRANHFESMNMG